MVFPFSLYICGLIVLFSSSFRFFVYLKTYFCCYLKSLFLLCHWSIVVLNVVDFENPCVFGIIICVCMMLCLTACYCLSAHVMPDGFVVVVCCMLS